MNRGVSVTLRNVLPYNAHQTGLQRFLILLAVRTITLEHPIELALGCVNDDIGAMYSFFGLTTQQASTQRPKGTKYMALEPGEAWNFERQCFAV